MSQNRLKAAAIGGSIAGVASEIPVLNVVNLACCALVVGGAMLAVYMALRNEPPTESAPLGAGAAIGALSGVIAAVAGTIISIPLALLFGNVAANGLQTFLESSDAVQIEGFPRDLLEAMAGSGEGLALGALLIGLILSLGFYTIFATLGGVVGAAIFRKKA